MQKSQFQQMQAALRSYTTLGRQKRMNLLNNVYIYFKYIFFKNQTIIRENWNVRECNKEQQQQQQHPFWGLGENRFLSIYNSTISLPGIKSIYLFSWEVAKASIAQNFARISPPK
jgi:hypothetical protein